MFSNDESLHLNDLSNDSNLQYLSHAEVVAKSPSIYSLAEIIILSIIITCMMIVIVVGNMLVVIAIATENNLTTVQNWFIASLAVADMLIGKNGFKQSISNFLNKDICLLTNIFPKIPKS